MQLTIVFLLLVLFAALGTPTKTQPPKPQASGRPRLPPSIRLYSKHEDQGRDLPVVPMPTPSSTKPREGQFVRFPSYTDPRPKHTMKPGIVLEPPDVNGIHKVAAIKSDPHTRNEYHVTNEVRVHKDEMIRAPAGVIGINHRVAATEPAVKNQKP